MTSFLARIRRAFLAGTISLVILLVRNCKYSEMLNFGMQLIKRSFVDLSIKDCYSLFFSLSPIIYILLAIISCIYIRSNGQFAAFNKQQHFVVTLLRCIGHDLASPLKAIRSISSSVFRFIWMMLWILICAFGLIYFI